MLPEDASGLQAQVTSPYILVGHSLLMPLGPQLHGVEGFPAPCPCPPLTSPMGTQHGAQMHGVQTGAPHHDRGPQGIHLYPTARLV